MVAISGLVRRLAAARTTCTGLQGFSQLERDSTFGSNGFRQYDSVRLGLLRVVWF